MSVIEETTSSYLNTTIWFMCTATLVFTFQSCSY